MDFTTQRLDHQPVLAITGLQFHVEPPLPAKITADQALHFAESLARGEPNRGKIALTAVSEKVREMILSRGGLSQQSMRPSDFR
jgi:hypothetical protein